jgi:hypothetical protein
MFYNFLQILGVSFLLVPNILYSCLFMNTVFSYVDNPGFGFINTYLYLFVYNFCVFQFLHLRYECLWTVFKTFYHVYVINVACYGEQF